MKNKVNDLSSFVELLDSSREIFFKNIPLIVYSKEHVLTAVSAI